jgi:hypothetical protein
MTTATVVLHPDKPTGSAELQRQLNDGRRQIEQRNGGEAPSTPRTEVMGGRDKGFVAVAAADIMVSFMHHAGCRDPQYLMEAEKRCANGELGFRAWFDDLGHKPRCPICNGPQSGEYRSTSPVECRGRDPYAARDYLNRLALLEAYRETSIRPMTATERANWLHDHKYPPGEDPNFAFSTTYKQRLLEAMKFGPAGRTRSSTEARQLTEEAYRPGHVWF